MTSPIIKLVAFSGSLRKASTNTGLLRAAKAHLPAGVSLDILSLDQVPFFNQDIAKSDWPASVTNIIKSVYAADGLVLGCPEYNYSLAPALKNILDWISREPDNAALSGKPVAIMGSAAGMGSSRSQYHLRQVCVFLNLYPLNKPEVFANAFAGGFNEQGDLIDPKLIDTVQAQMLAFKEWVLRLKG